MNIHEHFRALRGKDLPTSLVRGVLHRKHDYDAFPLGPVKLLAVGASKARYDFYPAAMEEPSFNAGETSADLFCSYYLAKRLLEKCPNIHTVLLFYSFYNMGYDLSKSNFKALCPLYSYCYGLPFRSISWSLKWGTAFKRWWASHLSMRVASKDGWEHPNSFTEQDIPALVAKHCKQATKYGTAPWTYFLKLRELCDTLEKRLVVVFPPERADYRAALAKFQPEQAIFKPFLPLQQEIIDARAWMQDGDFGDESHLSIDGAKKFSVKLKEALRRPEEEKSL